MNKERREELYEVTASLEDATSKLQEIIDAEQETFDNLPEGLQGSRTGESICDAVGWLDSIINSISLIVEEIENYIRPKKRKH